VPDISHQLREIASWRVASELLRRYPEHLALDETHPGGGQYDCLTLTRRGGREPREVIFDLNRNGSAHVRPHRPEGPALTWTGFWEDLASARDPKEPLDRLAAAADLPLGHKPPVSNPEVLSYRVIVALLTQAAFGRINFECRQGATFPPRRDWPGHFPGTPEAQPSDCWYLLRDGEPRLRFTTQGVATDRHGRHHDVPDLYAEHGRLFATTAVVGEHLFR